MTSIWMPVNLYVHYSIKKYKRDIIELLSISRWYKHDCNVIAWK